MTIQIKKKGEHMKNLKNVLAGLLLVGGFLTIAVSCEKDAKEYTIRIPESVLNGSVRIDANTVKEGGSVTITVTPNQNYLLASLTVNGQEVTVDENGCAVIENIMADQEVVVSFKGIDVPVRFMNDETIVSTKEIEFGTAYGTLPNLKDVPAGYTFDGWYTELAGKGEKITAETLLSNPSSHDIYAYCLANSYEITLDADGGKVEFDKMDATYHSAFGTLPVPTKVGHVFMGWTDESNKMVDESTIFEYTSDITLKAQYATVEVNQKDVQLTRLPGAEIPSITVTPKVVYQDKDLTDQFTFTLVSSNESAVVIDGMVVSLAANADQFVSTISVQINDQVYGQFDVTAMDYEGLGYQAIATIDQFKEMTGTGKYLLVSDIDFNHTFICNTVTWEPYINVLESGAVIDGNGHAVKNACLPGGWNKGWIGTVQGSIRNLSFINLKTADANPFGTGLIGTVNNYGTLENLFVQATILSDGSTEDIWTTGGVLIGNFDKGTISNIVLDVTVPENVTVNAYGAFAGVVVSYEASLYNSYAIVHHSGLAAYGRETVENLWTESTVKDGTGKLYNSVHTFLQEVKENTTFNGLWSFSDTELKFNDTVVLTSEPALSASIASKMIFELEDENTYVDFAVYAYGERTEDFTATYESTNLEIFTVDEMGVVTFVKEGTAELHIVVNGTINLSTTITINPKIIEISTAEQWRTLITANPSGTFRLVNDIDLAGGWFGKDDNSAIANEFTGVLDGQGYTVSNAWLIGGWAHSAPFGLNRGTIKNIGFLNIHSTSVNTNSALISDNQGLIENVYLDFIIESETKYGDAAGTLAYYSSTGIIRNCIVNARLASSEVTPTYYGSIVGFANAWAGTVTNSFAIVNDTGITDISALDAVNGEITTMFKNANCAQYTNYGLLKANANVTTFDSTLWGFNETTLTFGGKVVLTLSE